MEWNFVANLSTKAPTKENWNEAAYICQSINV